MSESEKPTFAMTCKDATVHYDSTRALSIPDLTISGNTIAIVGHNGAGKSTLLKSALGLLPTQGSIVNTFTSGGHTTPIRPDDGMAFCPENGAMFADVSVEAYIKLWCRIKCADANFYKKDGATYIEIFDVRPLLKKLGRELSKGQRRRVQTAVGFLTRPKVFMFDEPFCGLDIRRTFDLQTILTRESYNTAIVLASHRMEVVERIADHVIVLEKGSVVASGTTGTVAQRLCGTEYAIRDACDRIYLRARLEQQFPLSLVSEVGAEIRVVGPDLNRNDIELFVQSIDTNGAYLVDVSPTLVDALQYHFKKQSLEE